MLEKKIFNLLGHIGYGSIQLTMPNGEVHNFMGKFDGPNVEITVRDTRFFRAIMQQGDVGFARSYREGWWDTNNLSDLLLFGIKNEHSLDQFIYGNFLTKIASRIIQLVTKIINSKDKQYLYTHYDLGNEFFKLWLDPSMSYSSAIFSNKSEELISAQYRKYDRILDRIDNSGKLLEIGCGCGGFIERALEKRDYHIKGITVSSDHYAFAKHRLKNKAEIQLEDYRVQQGKYDYIVSIEMFEAVGEKNWPLYFDKIKELLTPQR